MSDINTFKIFFNFFLDSSDKEHSLKVYKKVMEGLKKMSDYTILTSRFQPAEFAPYEQVLDEFILPISLSGDFIIPWKYLKESVWSYTDETYSEAVSSAEYFIEQIFNEIYKIAGEKVGFIYFLSSSDLNDSGNDFTLKYYIADQNELRKVYTFDYKTIEEDCENPEEEIEIKLENLDRAVTTLEQSVEFFKKEGIAAQEPCIKIKNEKENVVYQDYELIN